MAGEGKRPSDGAERRRTASRSAAIARRNRSSSRRRSERAAACSAVALLRSCSSALTATAAAAADDDNDAPAGTVTMHRRHWGSWQSPYGRMRSFHRELWPSAERIASRRASAAARRPRASSRSRCLLVRRRTTRARAPSAREVPQRDGGALSIASPWHLSSSGRHHSSKQATHRSARRVCRRCSSSSSAAAVASTAPAGPRHSRCAGSSALLATTAWISCSISVICSHSRSTRIAKGTSTSSVHILGGWSVNRPLGAAAYLLPQGKGTG